MKNEKKILSWYAKKKLLWLLIPLILIAMSMGWWVMRAPHDTPTILKNTNIHLDSDGDGITDTDELTKGKNPLQPDFPENTP